MNMVEKLARAMARANYPGGSERDIDEMWEGWTEEAEACLTALSEPTPAMYDAAWEKMADHRANTDLEEVWKAMLAAASKD